MIKILSGRCCATVLTVFCLLAPRSALCAEKEQKYEPTPESLKQYEIPRWFTDAKFGIFIHWGVFAVPENIRYAERMYDEKGHPGTFNTHKKKYGDQKT